MDNNANKVMLKVAVIRIVIRSHITCSCAVCMTVQFVIHMLRFIDHMQPNRIMYIGFNVIFTMQFTDQCS